MDKEQINNEEAEEQVWEYAGKVSEDDVLEMTQKAEKMKGFFRHVNALKKYWADANDVLSLLRDRVSGKYSATPWRIIAALTGTLIYIFNPFDLVPDFIPGWGYLDDAAVFAAVLRFAAKDLEDYRAWRDGK
ncbi:MAG: DUF1232 domain-containing protein [Kiritimatiellae bacterium]|nr:DUF1232 domain-containing protein [Kiritimatiellia bacterium]